MAMRPGSDELASAPEFSGLLGHKRPEGAPPPRRPFKYLYVRFLGRGGYGHAFLVERVADGVRIVAKIIPIQGPGSGAATTTAASTAAKVDREIQALKAGSDHFGVTRLYDYQIVEGYAVLMMEFCDAGDLHRQITMHRNRGTIMDENVVRMVLSQLVFALHHLHRKKMLHRDIKSSNVLLCSTGLIKLCDLGLAKIAESAVAGDVATTFCGTPNYLAPEVWQRKKYGGKTDVYSLGVVVFHMMARRLPFTSKSVDVLRAQVINSSYDRLGSMNLPYSRELIALCESMMSVDPAQRPDTTQLLRNPIVAGIAQALPDTLARSAQISRTTAEEILLCLRNDGVPYGDDVGRVPVEDPPPSPHNGEVDVDFALDSSQCDDEGQAAAQAAAGTAAPAAATGGEVASPAIPEGELKAEDWRSIHEVPAGASGEASTDTPKRVELPPAAVQPPTNPNGVLLEGQVYKMSSSRRGTQQAAAGTSGETENWAPRRLVLTSTTLTLFPVHGNDAGDGGDDGAQAGRSARLAVSSISSVTRQPAKRIDVLAPADGEGSTQGSTPPVSGGQIVTVTIHPLAILTGNGKSFVVATTSVSDAAHWLEHLQRLIGAAAAAPTRP